MPPFRPWIGIEKIDPVKRGIGQLAKQLNRIIVMQADIIETAATDGRHQFGQPVDKGLTTEMADLGMDLGIAQQMFAAAKADFQPIMLISCCKNLLRHNRFLAIDGQLRKQAGQAFGLFFAQFLAVAAAKKGPRFAKMIWEIALLA